MAHARVRLHIRRPVDEVFAYIADYNKNALWQQGVISSRQVTPGPPRVGTEVAYTRTVLGREFTTSARIVELEPDRRIRIESRSRLATYRGGYDFAARDGGTDLTYAGELSLSRALALVGRRLARGFQDQMQSDLERLRGMLES